jgi:7,8-dihydropterin-6-yl-methyl-4-(beta-D-ribofuranosyl)aminobenzene 5'-phosphate synthase
MLFLQIIFSLVLLISLLIFIKILKMRSGRAKAEAELSQIKIEKLKNFGSVKSLSFLPLIDYYTDDPDLATEDGVSYLVKADDKTILFDAGYNKNGEDPSPLLRNMKKLGHKPAGMNMIFLSHRHRDHVGGTAAESRNEFTLSAGPVKMKKIPVYAPSEIKPAQNHPDLPVTVVKEPLIIDKGIVSIGAYPRSLFLIGYTTEHSLAVNVKGKGIVLIIGCGHQGIHAIIERAKQIFDEPIYAVIGGLHFPVNGGRMMVGPFNMQNFVGVDRNPFRGITEKDVNSAIALLKSLNPAIVALSPHDSSDWALDKFREAFGERYRDIKVGVEIKI